MPKLYRVTWEDWNGKPAVNVFFAVDQTAAETIVEELCAICDASWRELKEDGTPVTPLSGLYQQPAVNDSRWASFAILNFFAGAASSPHSVKLRAVKKTYVSIASRRTSVNPFTDLSRLKTSEGEPFTTFNGATYGRTNR